MLAFAKDITKIDPNHPEESKNDNLKKYMEYQRQINQEKLIHHALDHTKTYLQQAINDARGDDKKVQAYTKKAFPASSRFANGDSLMLMLRKLTNAHNATKNWYRMNHYYNAVAYDALDRFIRIYNRLLREAPEKAAEYDISSRTEVDFDDWVRLYFQDLDFLVGQRMNYVHFDFRKRNRAIEEKIQQETTAGKSKEDALKAAAEEFNIEPAAVQVILGKEASQADMELFYTSTENPIYQYLYDPNAEGALQDGETLIDHSYFLAHQLRGLSETEAEQVLSEIQKLSNS